ncbi:hypothetical protein AZI85_17225 [Bdellovibrio bacteriovorus]|uniref:ASCH domain-containing protein n=1 Tax=Bdellovibrio bacteriovorus TaxID=959 RepID=A0A150WTA0_BDEBC|nr:ASCH domain-containing protein [Bdellovibrio bacteriovorus]KYG67621.1 hypothetical protein AZI85_17225 [Bdellovibrio bacteriovorus]
MKPRVIQGINIQWPWSELLVSGKKTVETRSYPLPARLIDTELAIIETPGPNGKRAAGITKARIIGTITFTRSYKYKTKTHWRSEYEKHLVSPDDSLFGYRQEKEKYGWVVGMVEKLDNPAPAPSKRGIIFAKACKVGGRQI